MIFFNSYPASVYIKKKSLEFIVGNNRKSLEFPDDVTSNADIINPEKYEKLVEEFITTNNLKKQKVLLVLADEIIFDKTFPNEDLKILDDKINDFLDMVPIDPGKIAQKNIKSDKGIYFFAVNKDLFEKLVEVMERSGVEVLAAVPLTAFSEEKDLSVEIIKKIFDNKNLINESNLLSENPDLDSNSSVKKFLFFAVFLISAVSVGIYLFTNNYFKFSLPFFTQNLNQVQENIQANPTPTESAKEEIASSSGFLDADQLKALVLNGTGIAGQAAKVKNVLEELGLSNIETGNVEGPSVKETTVAFSKNVSEDLQTQIISSLENDFASVSAKNKVASPSTDIVITTGKPKISP